MKVVISTTASALHILAHYLHTHVHWLHSLPKSNFLSKSSIGWSPSNSRQSFVKSMKHLNLVEPRREESRHNSRLPLFSIYILDSGSTRKLFGQHTVTAENRNFFSVQEIQRSKVAQTNYIKPSSINPGPPSELHNGHIMRVWMGLEFSSVGLHLYSLLQ